MKRALLAVAAACALMASPAAALTIVQTQTAAAASGGTTGLDFSQFDSSLGTLNSVLVEFNYAMPTVSGTLKNTTGNKHQYNFDLTDAVSLTGAGVNLTDSETFHVDVPKINGGVTYNLGPFNWSDAQSATFTSPASLTAFIGSGDYLLNFGRTVTTSFNPAPQGLLAIAPTLGATVKVTYDYTAPIVKPPVDTPVGGVPEPATWAMMIFGFGVTGGVLRRRRDQVAMVAAA